MKFNGKSIVEQSEVKKNNKWILVLSIIYLLLSIIYLAMPYDYDKITFIGRIDDFLLFMSAFCFVYTQFMSKYNIVANLILKILSAAFALFAAICLFILYFIS